MGPATLREQIRQVLAAQAGRCLDNDEDRWVVEEALVAALAPEETLALPPVTSKPACHRCVMDSMGVRDTLVASISNDLRRIDTMSQLHDFPHQCGKVCGEQVDLPGCGNGTCVLPPDHLTHLCYDGAVTGRAYRRMILRPRDNINFDQARIWRLAQDDGRRQLEADWASRHQMTPARAHIEYHRAAGIFPGDIYRR